MYFENFGRLDWLDVEDYYAGPWRFVCVAIAEDGEKYDIVAMDAGEVRYTTI